LFASETQHESSLEFQRVADRQEEADLLKPTRQTISSGRLSA